MGFRINLLNQRLYTIIRILTGGLFILSAIAKALDSNHFGLLISSYGNSWLYIMAPVIIFMELVIGICLFLKVYVRMAALSAAVLIVGFSIIYSYGLVFLNIGSCGCFGHLQLWDTPIAVFIRNALLLSGAIYMIKKSPYKTTGTLPDKTSIITASLLILVTMFICGNTLRINNIYTPEQKTVKFIPLESHPLNSIIDTAPDSTYLVTIFSYSCPHCINSIGNIELYEISGIVNKTIGITITDSVSRKEFYNFFNPRFTIIEYPHDIIAPITEDFPVSFLIVRDTIMNIMKGEVPSPYFFRSRIRKGYDE